MSTTSQSLSFRAPLSGTTNTSLPWSWWNQWCPITINNMATSAPEKETHIVQNVASYGKQLGRIMDVISVLLKDQKNLGKTEQKAVDAFLDLAAEVSAAKAGFAASTPENIEGVIGTVRYWKNHDEHQYELIRNRLLQELEAKPEKR